MHAEKLSLFLRTGAKERITANLIGRLSKEKLQQVDAAIRLHLGV